ncbi:TSUP family transporter [Achromobacter sp. Marseille-Q0513]|uniref:TSUP family transporter n=1 Tax=Achromobacter sp. Marseille-Q0513 TaxID=2829161 RepID=UPI001B930928|nr:TSUP family transporter [Achromobacter sp. Marseille-Q0513]MBR8657797.1 TSUP family transporter [Achromobacter sp. Marseille-Q0513]
MSLDVQVVAVALLAVGVIGFMKGAFGGGFAIIGIPLLALVMDPIAAGSLLAPLFVAMDVFALRYWRPRTWSRPDLLWLLPGLLAGGFAGAFLLPPGHRPAGGIPLAPTAPLLARVGGGGAGPGAPGARG